MKKTPITTPEELLKIPLFSGLSIDEVLPLVDIAHKSHLQAGGFFYHRGDPAERMYVLIEGQVRLSSVGMDGKQVLIQVIKPVHLFGLVAMTASNEYPVTAQASKDSLAVYWTQRELMEQVLKLPRMALNAMRILADQLHELQERYHQASTQRVEQRLAHTLIRLAAQSGRRVSEGILIDHPLSRQDLAEMSGTTLYTASRTLSQWHEQALVIAGREKVIIKNPHGLAKIVERASM